MSEQLIKDFPITVYGNLEKYNEVISKGRCRIFYKGANRNGTFINDAFADKLIATLPYTPVKGIYDDDSKDYTDHGKQRNLGRIYGVVPAEPNFAWEKHLDEDGVEREYACTDVLYYTALYGEAQQISGKSQSMELYGPSIKGQWKILGGKKYYEFEDGCFLGLQVLGDSTEPCFEGAAFYELIQTMQDLVDKIEEYNKNFQNNGEGGHKMPEMLFKLSDSQKEVALLQLLNAELDEDGYRIYNYSLYEVYDDYAIAYYYPESQFYRVYYTKDDATDSVEINAKKKCYMIDVTEEERTALEKIRTLNGDTYEKVDEIYSSVGTLTSSLEEANNQIAILTENVTKVTNDYELATNQLNEEKTNAQVAQNTIQELTSERDALVAYRKNVEDTTKLAIIDNYTTILSADIITKYKSEMDNYNCEQLDMNLTYEQKKACPDTFTKNIPMYVPKEGPSSGIESILDKYEKK